MANLDLILIIDVETTGLNPTTDEVIELGCILFSLSHNCVLQQVSTLVPVSMDVSPTEHINGITAGAGYSLLDESFLEAVVEGALSATSYADAFVAHNAKFDRDFLAPWLGDSSSPWIDSRSIQWPRAYRQGCNLVELALCYEIPVFGNHRALADCQLLASIIQREPNAAQLLAKELEPKVWATWRTVASDRDGQAKAKAAGFRWKDKNCPADGVWSRKMHPSDVAGLGFEVVTLPCA